MKRFGRVLRLREGAEKDYEKYHVEVWPEVVDTIYRSGIRNYTIFRYGPWLFSYFELPDNVTMDDVENVIKESDACSRWEKLMHDLQEPMPESKGDSWWVDMKELWHNE